MALLDQLKDLLGMGGKLSDEHANLAGGLLETLSSGQSGGLQGLIQSFQTKGLGEIVSSWVGSGSNLPISAEQVETGLGGQVIQQLATRVGVSPDTAKSALATLLPLVVDRLTPDGKVPEASQLQEYLNKFKSKLAAQA